VKSGVWMLLAATALLLASACTPSLAVPPRLVARWPMPGAHLSVSRYTFELTFNRVLDGHASWAAVTSDHGGAIPTDVSVDPNEARRLQVHLLEPAAGEFELTWHTVAAGSSQASDGEQTFVLESGTPAPPHIDIGPTVAEVGDRLELTGKGFATQTSLQLTIGDDDRPLASTQTDDHGRFNFEARVPPSVPYGLQRISVFDGTQRVATGSLQVHWGGWPPLVAADSGQAGPDHGQVTFTLNLRNASDYVLEHIHVVLADPDGGRFVSADAGGRRDGNSLVWDIPVMDRGVYGPLHVTYLADRPLVSHAWFEFRHRAEHGCADGDCLPPFISTSTADSAAISP
jgi:hypothetical protein